MKKKLAAIDPRVKLGLVVLGLIVLAFAGRTLLVSPQNATAAKLKTEVAAEQAATFEAQAALRAGSHRPTIRVADLFRLARAMPDREDMPGVILTLSQLARSSGITLSSVAPSAVGAAAATGGYATQDIHLLFNGDFYSLSDFLYRMRNLVTVHHGKLHADGRLFNVQTLNLTVAAGSFPELSADLTVEAYVYVGTAPVAAPAPATTDPATPDPTAASGATAAGVSP
jgi:Tfp pilus assembly protein PilO